MNRAGFFKSIGAIAALAVLPKIALPVVMEPEAELLDVRKGDVILDKTGEGYYVIAINEISPVPVSRIRHLSKDITLTEILRTNKYTTIRRMQSECGRYTNHVGICKDPFRK